MPPKKRDRESESAKQPRLDHIQADHELFLQAFEKPTQIYRFLRTRNMLSPIFLNRTLTYMKQRMSRSNKARTDYKVDSVLEKLMSLSNNVSSLVPPAGILTLSFIGFYHKTVDDLASNVEVETLLLKICHKKRKDSSSPIMQVSCGIAEVPVNPIEVPGSPATITISTESFGLSNGPLVKSYLLLLRVKGTRRTPEGEAEPQAKKPRPLTETNGEHALDTSSKIYGSELIVYDKHNRCLLTDGEYELCLQEVVPYVKSSPKKHSSWENIADVNDLCAPFDVFCKEPSLKFRLSWGDGKKPRADKEESSAAEGDAASSSERMQIIYQFLYNNNSRQQTEACEDLHCPWCSLNCKVLYSLLKHLKLCHSRFTFKYVPIAQGARIDVAINELYDGSYTGSPQDLISQPTVCAFSRNGPVRRASVTHILVCRPKRSKPSLSEFLELDDAEYDGQRPYITGHNRLYHHTTTCLPIYPKEMDVDSEGENDPKWLQAKTMMMIDDFTDVNEGEKELMKMWNLHVMKEGFVGDCQIPLACNMFIQNKGKELLLKNLYRNFVLHMCSLFDFGLASPVTVYGMVQKLQEMVGETGAIRRVLCESREAQMDNWVRTGSAAQAATPKTIRKAITPRRKVTSEPTARPSEATRKRSCLSLNKSDKTIE